MVDDNEQASVERPLARIFLAVTVAEARRVEAVLDELGIGFVPFSPLGRGFLAGGLDASTPLDASDFRNQLPRFSAENRQANQGFVDWLRTFAAQRNATPAQIALAWLLAQRPWVVPIPATTKRHRLKENLGAATLTLTSSDLVEIDEALAAITLHGDRYPEALQRQVGR